MQIDQKRIDEIFQKTDAIITNTHVVYTSGRHGASYVNKDALYVHTGAIAELCAFMAAPFAAEGVDVVAGPTIGGVVLSQWVAHALNMRRKSGETLSVYSEEEERPEGKTRVLKRGYDELCRGANVLVVEDVLTTGGSARKVVEAVRALGGNVVALSALCNRGGVTEDMVGSVPLKVLVNVNMDSFAEDNCPLCSSGVPVNTRVGKGRAFLERKAQQAR